MAVYTINQFPFANSVINATFSSKVVVGIYAFSHEYASEFLELLAGINANQGKIKIDEQDVFDNKVFFQKRLYFNFEKACVSTLRSSFLKGQLQSNLHLSFDENRFMQLVKSLNIRQELQIDCRYHFTKAGNCLVNYAFVKAIDKPILFVDNPTIHLKSSQAIETIALGLTDKTNYDFVFLGLDNVKAFEGLLDWLIIIGNEKTVVINPNEHKLMVIKGNPQNSKDVFYKKEVSISLDSYDKVDLKVWDRQKIDYKRISPYDVEVFR
jgi:hypothetical protein